MEAKWTACGASDADLAYSLAWNSFGLLPGFSLWGCSLLASARMVKMRHPAIRMVVLLRAVAKARQGMAERFRAPRETAARVVARGVPMVEAVPAQAAAAAKTAPVREGTQEMDRWNTVTVASRVVVSRVAMAILKAIVPTARRGSAEWR